MSDRGVAIEVHACIDKRSRRTRALLAEALLSLGAENRIDELGVRELTDQAGVSRSTFYQHFSSKDDFVVKSWVALLEATETAYAKAYPRRTTIIASQPIFQHVSEARDFVRSLVGSEIYPRQMAAGEARLRAIAETNITRRMPHWSKDRCRETAIYVAAGFVGILRWWMESGLKRSPADVETAFQRLTEGLLSEPSA